MEPDMTEDRCRGTAPADQTLHRETQMMSYGFDPFLSEGAIKPPIFLTSTFVFRSAEEGADSFDMQAGRKPVPEGSARALIYSRFNHPNLEIVEDRLALLDGAEACAVTASGMAAISTLLLAFLRPGEVIVHSAPLYGGTETLIDKLLPEFGIKSVVFRDGLSAEEMRAALEGAAALGRVPLFYVEAPANPTNALIDFAAMRGLLDEFAASHGYRPIAVCDNTLLGPVFQRPLDHGVDMTVYSLTKYVGGHSDLVAGGLCGSKPLIARARSIRGAFGVQADPHTCWMIGRSLETLFLRMERAAETGRTVANWLADNPYQKVRLFHPEHLSDPAYRVVYRRQCTGPGSTFSFVLEGGRPAAFRFINALTVFKSAVSLGGTESLICHPASTTHSGVPQSVRESVGVSDGLIRVSLGLEHPEDLIADLKRGFAAV